MGMNPPDSTLTFLSKLLNKEDTQRTLVVLDNEPEAIKQAMYITSTLAGLGIRVKFAVGTFKDLASASPDQRERFLAHHLGRVR